MRIRVKFNAEYDAVPDIGQAYGHNLIAAGSVAAFMALTFAIQQQGINALNAAVTARNKISMLRQQVFPDERVHWAILSASSITNAIPEFTIRSRKKGRPWLLATRVKQRLEAGALATGCNIELQEDPIYGDLVVNPPLCRALTQPALHAAIGISVSNGAKNHTRQFAAAVLFL
ncbi:hypothetical protein ABOM_000719 [Aspergillus bombycis]|uniref:Uncharacterized protein n=1 Tax=Aspergillus bombycis TaxID=109264 RepID=A0A1F8AGV6_9EURO|nr:hypothetical protein ABOM_000719 [Aspergillus bombycis]OGM50927.1 hypothetical protein ABOM_000719 [Aspergillus bombycis]